MSDGVTHRARGGREGSLLAREPLGSWEGQAAAGLEMLQLLPEAPFVLHRAFDVGEGEKCESSPVLLSGKEMPPPSAALSAAGACATLQKSFLTLGPGWLPARTGGSAGAGTTRPSQLCGTTVSVLECVQALPPEHPAGMPWVLPSPWGCKPTSKGFISLIQLVPVPPSKTWLTSAGAQPAQGVPGTGAHWSAAPLPH